MADAIKKLSDLFAKFPTVGSRTARRFVFYLLSLSRQEIDQLAKALYELKDQVKYCAFCFNPHQLQGNLCEICQDNGRNRKLLCIVEKESDLLSIEKAK